MTVQPIEQLNTLQAAGMSAANANLGKDEFLKLLIAQLRNQDPMKPMEDREFIAQLAQFNSLEQMQNLNTSFSQMLKWQQLSQSSALIGKKIEAVKVGGVEVRGTVSEIKIGADGPMLKVGQEYIPLGSISKIY